MVDDTGTELRGEEVEFVQDMGLFVERMGLTPVAGQMIAWLMICDPPHQSASELKDALQVAKSTVSTTVRSLMQLGFIEKIRIHGERIDYYRFNHLFVENSIKKRMESMNPFVNYFKKALELNDRDKERVEVFKNMIEMAVFFDEEYKKIYERWKKLHPDK